MSRIGKMPISVPAGVDVKIDSNVVTVKGPKAVSYTHLDVYKRQLWVSSWLRKANTRS